MSSSIEPCSNQQKHSSIEIQIQEELEKYPLNSELEPDNVTDAEKHRRHMRNFFDSIDMNHDGVVQIDELQQYMGNYLRPSMAKFIAKQIHSKYDVNSDGKLNFEEFYEMSLRKEYKFHRLLFKYCRYVVPPRTQDEDSLDPTYEESISFWPPPLTMITFSLIQIAAYIICHRYNEGQLCEWLKYNPKHRSEIWRFVTYMFAHSDLYHIMGNLILQIFLGLALELVHHWWRVSLVYVSGVLAGSLGHSLTSTNCLAGASAGVYALIAAHFATVLMNWGEMVHPGFQLIVILIYCTTDGYYSYNDYFYNGNRGIGYVSHLCGAVAGLLVGIRVLRNLRVKKWEKTVWKYAVVLFCTLMFAGILANIFFYESIIGTAGQ